MRGGNAVRSRWMAGCGLVLATLPSPPVHAGAPPAISSASPGTVRPGSAVVVRLFGAGFTEVTGVEIDGGYVLGYFVVSSGEIILDVVVPDDEEIGPTAVHASSQYGSGSCNNCISIAAGAPTCESLNGRNVIVGTAAAETLNGTSVGDVICARGGSDIVLGAEGDDVILGGADDDDLDGNAGADAVFGESGNDSLHVGGMVDGDRTFGLSGADRFLPDPGGQDLISGPAGLIYGGAGRDVVRGNGLTGPLRAASYRFVGVEAATGSDHDDHLQGFEEASGGRGADRLEAADRGSKLTGGDGSDWLQGGPGGDTLKGGDGPDSLEGFGGTDLLIGGQGIDDLEGGGGRDTLRGGADDDSLDGEGGPDEVAGNGGADELIGGADNDHINAEDPNPTRDTAIDGGGGARDTCSIDRADRGVPIRCEVLD